MITYYILSWGGVSKSLLKKVEIDQRPILQVYYVQILSFLLQNGSVLTMRWLVNLDLILKQHTQIKFDSAAINKRRKDTVCEYERRYNTFFAHKFSPFLGPYTYN